MKTTIFTIFAPIFCSEMNYKPMTWKYFNILIVVWKSF